MQLRPAQQRPPKLHTPDSHATACLGQWRVKPVVGGTKGPQITDKPPVAVRTSCCVSGWAGGCPKAHTRSAAIQSSTKTHPISTHTRQAVSGLYHCGRVFHRPRSLTHTSCDTLHGMSHSVQHESDVGSWAQRLLCWQMVVREFPSALVSCNLAHVSLHAPISTP